MKIKNKSTMVAIGLIAYITVKVILSNIGIENIPATVIVALLLTSYIIVVIGIWKMKTTGRQRTYLLIFLGLFLILCFAGGAIAIFLYYFPELISENISIVVVLLVIGLLSMFSLIPISIKIKNYANRKNN